MAGTVENAAIDRSSSDSHSNSVNHHNNNSNGKVVNHLCYYTNHHQNRYQNHKFNGNHTGDIWEGGNGGGGVGENYHMVVNKNFNGGGGGYDNGGGGGGEAMKREMRDLEELLSKLNPMAEEFVPPSLLVNGNHNQLHVNNTNYFGLPGGGDASGFGGYGFPTNFIMQQVQMDSGNGNGQMIRRKKGNYGQGRQRMNNRTSMAQREEVIKRTVYVCDIDQQVTEEQLAGLFLNCGQVVDCRVCGDPNSILRFAFVEFTDEDGARVALTLSGTMLGYYPVRVLPSKTAIAPVNPTFLPRSEDEREMCARTIYCTNIDKKITQADVKLFFESICGEVYRIRLLGDYQHSTRIAFVEFVMAESAIAALNCSGAILGTLPLRISPSKTPVRPRSPRPAFN